MKLSEEIANWIKSQVEKAGKRGVVFGLSGGLDSSVVGALSKLAMGDNVLGLVLPCQGDAGDVEFARKAAKKFGLKTKEIALDSIFEQLVKAYPEASSLAKANLKPRLRMTALYYFANTLDYLVAGTGNKSELAIGYFTKYGDGGVDILPLGELLKTEVKKLAAELGVPREIIERAPSAGLWRGQTDEGEIGVTYDELDMAIKTVEGGRKEGVNEKVLRKVRKMMQNSKHKRAEIPMFLAKGGKR